MPSDRDFSALEHADTRNLLVIAKNVTATAGELVRAHAPHTLTFKGDRDVTSNVDLAVEKLVRDLLHEQTPDAKFLGEEEGGSDLDKDDHPHWVLDPIDGTVNFIHGVPLCAISLSLVQGGRVLAAVIDLPFFDVQYSALLGHGSHVNDQKLRVSSTRQLAAALVSIDQFTFGEDAQYKNLVRHSLIRHLATHVQRVRILGTSAIDLAWTAQGRLDACIMMGNKPWDTSAGILIAREAGARILDVDGSDHSMHSSTTIAVTPALENDLMPVLRAALADVAPVSCNAGVRSHANEPLAPYPRHHRMRFRRGCAFPSRRVCAFPSRRVCAVLR